MGQWSYRRDRNSQHVKRQNGRWWAVSKSNGRNGAGAVGRGLGHSAALTLVAVSVHLAWDWGREPRSDCLELDIRVGRATSGPDHTVMVTSCLAQLLL